jgi:hypothetical protein
MWFGFRRITHSSTETISSVPSSGRPSFAYSFHGLKFIPLSAYSVAASRSSGYFFMTSPIATL